jgi:putative nucleotidyltransferase with HDIG domain
MRGSLRLHSGQYDCIAYEVESYNCAVIKAFAGALEIRDAETHGHSERVVRFSLQLGRELGLGGTQLRSLELGALLHDIGKMAMPDAILRKPAKLTDEGWIRMRQHPLLGQRMLRGMKFLEGASVVVAQHHENGTAPAILSACSAKRLI